MGAVRGVSALVRLTAIVGHPSEPGPYLIRVKVPGGVKLMPHKHPEDRLYTVTTDEIVASILSIQVGEAVL